MGLDVASAGLHVTERIGRDVAGRLDLEEAIEASLYASLPLLHPPQRGTSLSVGNLIVAEWLLILNEVDHDKYDNVHRILN